jgi:hypothetical protein
MHHHRHGRRDRSDLGGGQQTRPMPGRPEPPLTGTSRRPAGKVRGAREHQPAETGGRSHLAEAVGEPLAGTGMAVSDDGQDDAGGNRQHGEGHPRGARHRRIRQHREQRQIG